MKKNAPIVLLLHYVFLNTEVVKGVLSLTGGKDWQSKSQTHPSEPQAF